MSWSVAHPSPRWSKFYPVGGWADEPCPPAGAWFGVLPRQFHPLKLCWNPVSLYSGLYNKGQNKSNLTVVLTVSKQTNTLCILGATLCQRLLNSEVSRQQLVKRNVPPCCQRESVGHLSSRTQTGVAASLMTTCWGSCFLLTLPDILLASCCSASA